MISHAVCLLYMIECASNDSATTASTCTTSQHCNGPIFISFHCFLRVCVFFSLLYLAGAQFLAPFSSELAMRCMLTTYQNKPSSRFIPIIIVLYRYYSVCMSRTFSYNFSSNWFVHLIPVCTVLTRVVCW